MCTAHRNNHPATSTREAALVVTTTSQQQNVVLACHVRSLIGLTNTPHVACAPHTAHTAHRAHSNIAIVKIKLDSKATASKICVPSHNRWMMSAARISTSQVVLRRYPSPAASWEASSCFLRPSMASMAGGGEGHCIPGHRCKCMYTRVCILQHW